MEVSGTGLPKRVCEPFGAFLEGFPSRKLSFTNLAFFELVCKSNNCKEEVVVVVVVEEECGVLR